MRSLLGRALLCIIAASQPAHSQATITAFPAFGACGKGCITSAISDGLAQFSCSGVATPASCVCQQEASHHVYDGIVACVNYFCTPSSTSIATQIFESYCAGGVLPITAPAAQSSASASTPLSATSTVTSAETASTSSSASNSGSGLSTDARAGVISGSVLGGLSVIIAVVGIAVAHNRGLFAVEGALFRVMF